MKIKYKRQVTENEIFYGNRNVVFQNIWYDGTIAIGPYNISKRKIIKDQKNLRLDRNGEYSSYGLNNKHRYRVGSTGILID